MNAFIFVAVACIGLKCDFVTSTVPLTQQHCEVIKKQYLELPFRPEVTLAAAQCMPFESNEKGRL